MIGHKGGGARVGVTAALLAICIGPCVAQQVEVEGLRQQYRGCHAMANPAQRLVCYDALHTKLELPTYKGFLAEETDLFKVDRPTLLRYQSDGPIFVMYLKDANGTVVQNLHIGGGGESTFLITKPGDYRLQVSGSDHWRIWVEPQGAKLETGTPQPHG